MKTNFPFLIIAILVLAASCGPKDEISIKKEELAKMKADAASLRTSIETLEKEIAVLDPEFAKENRKSILISTTKVEKKHFEHFVEVTGSVLSKKNVSISGEVLGRIQEITAVEGMRVSKGQILAKIDAETILRNIDEVEKQLELAKILFDKQDRLWKQQIGTEIQYLESKNRKETLEANLASLKTQQSKTLVRAPFNGTVETVQVRLGELVQPGVPMFQFVGDSDLFIEADISEKYVGLIQRGDSVEVSFPSVEKELRAKITSVGAIINPNNRTFKVEIAVPSLEFLKPNMISVIKIMDYENKTAVTVPNYLILQDNKGDYVYTVDESLSKKRYIKRGKTYKEVTEVLEGLTGTEVLVDKGFREVGDNFVVNIAK
ncbi:efflux RND transporter periplasmic adaptor subunit [Aquiflexum gelatinilyticum]|uniref:Efflux RND transporter periplasmic adaptor subunit n=1 Tax=Aquiflexum gelatinilyticum TaxID=2961943 RepID=A0A9X2P7X9_9BACT|nr:efflux RND transporter periplasmic adaptor subunit [Aquiflexum gelatinilyticum]MCR9015375.1 efflux RND transporter periplasmic adaptor subunit [Aquiflexum gelatinilyticum]